MPSVAGMGSGRSDRLLHCSAQACFRPKEECPPLGGAADASALPVRHRQHVGAGAQVCAAVDIHKAPRHRLHILRKEVAKAAAPCGSSAICPDGLSLIDLGSGCCRGFQSTDSARCARDPPQLRRATAGGEPLSVCACGTCSLRSVCCCFRHYVKSGIPCAVV